MRVAFLSILLTGELAELFVSQYEHFIVDCTGEIID